MPRPPGKNALKRRYANAWREYSDAKSCMSDLQAARVRLPGGVLAPAIDVLYDQVDAAEREYRAVLKACQERGIRSAYGHSIRGWFLDGEPNHEDDHDEP